jgi:hypothetical protein
MRAAFVESLQSDLMRATSLALDVEERDLDTTEFIASLNRIAAFYRSSMLGGSLSQREMRRATERYIICKVFLVYTNVFIQSTSGTTTDYNDVLRALILNGADPRMCTEEFAREFGL